MSAGALDTGTAFKKLDHQIWLTEISSYKVFWQTVGRLFEMDQGKDIVPVVLPSWNMFVEMFTELALYTQKPGQPLADVTKVMLDMVPGIDWSGEPKVIDYSMMIKQQLTNNLKGASWKSPKIINYTNIQSLSKDERSSIPDLSNPEKKGPRKDINGTNDGHKSGKNSQLIIDRKGSKTQRRTDKSTAEKIQNFMKHMPSVIANAYIAGHICSSYKDLHNIPDEYFNSYVCVGAKQDYGWFINRGLLDTNELDRRIEWEKQLLGENFSI